jgi:hypothetical protein
VTSIIPGFSPPPFWGGWLILGCGKDSRFANSMLNRMFMLALSVYISAKFAGNFTGCFFVRGQARG